MIQLIGPALAGARLIGGAANVGRYAAGTGATLASLLTGSALNSGRRQNINERPVVNPQFLRPDYSGAGERARRFQEYKTGRDIPGANTDYSDRLAGSGYSSAPAAERAYQATKSSVAQQAAQNPEFQRYEAARKGAKTQEEMDAARDIGMQMWAKANPGLAAKVKPGQSGYNAIQSTLNAGQMGAPADMGAFTGAQPTAFLDTGAPATTSYAGVTPATAGMSPIGPNALTGAYTPQAAAPFTRFAEGPTLSSQPLGAPSTGAGPIPGYDQLTSPQNYGLSSIQGAQGAFDTDAAKGLADEYLQKMLKFSAK